MGLPQSSHLYGINIVVELTPDPKQTFFSLSDLFTDDNSESESDSDDRFKGERSKYAVEAQSLENNGALGL